MADAPHAIPMLPAMHARALALASRPDVGVTDIARVVEGDPALTLAVLRAANSAAQLPARPIGTVTDAIVRIGMRATRRIVTGATTSRAFADVAQAGLDLDEFWRHALASALLADASAWPNGPRTEAFTAGLLHDLGRLAMAVTAPDQYRFVIHRAAGGEPVGDAERAVFGVDHVEFGHEVATSWDLPGEVVSAIAGHHDGEGSALVWVTYKGRELAASLGFGDGIAPATTPAPVETGVGGDIIRSLGGAAGVRRKIGWYQGVLSVHAAAA